MSKKEDRLLDLLLRVYECPDVMFVIDGEDSSLARDIKKVIDENFE